MGCSIVGVPPSNNTDSGTGLAGAIGRRFRTEILGQFQSAGVDYDWADDELYTFIASAVAEAFIADCELGAVTSVTQTFDGNGLTASLNLDNVPLENTVKAFVAGLRATPVTSFSVSTSQLEVIVSGNTVTFGQAPSAGADVIIDYSTLEEVV